MKNNSLRIIKIITVLLLGFLLFACSGSKVNEENYDKVQTGMSTQQVIDILGEPTSEQSFNIAGLSGTTATWKVNDSTIVVQFFNDRMQIKAYNKKIGPPDKSN